MALTDNQLKEILIKSSYVNKQQLDKALEYSKDNNISIIQYFLDNQVITKDELGKIIANYYGVPYADLNSNPPSEPQRKKIPENIAKKNRIVLYKQDGDSAVITTDLPDKKGLVPLIKNILKAKKVTLNYSLSEDIDKILKYYRKPLKDRLKKIIREKKYVAPRVIEENLNEALALQSSDIHLEPYKDNVKIRFRVDGLLQEMAVINKEIYDNILNWVKIQASLRIDEHFAAQDGGLRMIIHEEPVDLRISIIPTLEGEKIAIRILSKYVKDYTYDDLGISKKNHEIIHKSASSPFGMIIVSGPTGSGKTTTLYALLKKIAKPDINITTIEDPVEYKVPGINQIQVNERTKLSFSKGLRTIVRQDPDVILVGEIRDKVTAEIAVNAALTGHLLLSTFHANDAATTIPRLLDMGVEPFLLSSTLEIIISQRLVRRICENCRTSYTMKLDDLCVAIPSCEKYFSKKETTFFKGTGCDNCNGTGYKGRIGVFEIIKVNQPLKELIQKNPSKTEILNLMKENGFEPMFEDGIKKLKQGITTIEEIIRVTQVE